jgi:hypothetical protein
MHQFVLGVPATKFSSALGAPRTTSRVINDVARELPLGIDGLFDTIKTLAQVAGMAIGVATGVPLVHLAACKAFVHDHVTRGLTREFDEALMSPPRGKERTHAAQVESRQPPRRRPTGRTGVPERDDHTARSRRGSVQRKDRQSRGDTPHARG